MSRNRSERVGPLIFEEISRLLLNKLEDPRLKDVSLTKVKLTKDLKLGRVYFSVMGDKKQIKDAQTALSNAKGKFKNIIAQNCKLKYVPELEFHYDRNLAHASKINEILHKIHEQEKDMENGNETGD
jgi:ribosome-binding factor A